MHFSKFKFLKKYFVTIVFLLFLNSCNEKKENPIFYKDKNEIIDVTCKWLGEKKNFYKAYYSSTFYNYYNKKIKEKNYKLAAQALEIVSIKKAYFSNYDKEFVDTMNYFYHNYKSKINFYDGIFLDSFFGNMFDNKGDFKKALFYYSKMTLKEPIDYESCKNIGYAYYNISFCYYSIGEQDLALKNSFKSLDYYKRINDELGLGYSKTSLSMIYAANHNYPMALKSNEKALHHYKKVKDTGNIYITLFDKILIYEDSGNKKMYPLIDSTYTAFKNSKIEDEVLKISLYSYYAEKLLVDDKIKEAKNILDELKPIVEKLNSESSTREYITSYANYEIKKNDGTINTNIILKAIPSLIENENYQVAISFYNALKNISVKKNDYKSALYYEEETRKAYDSASSKEMKNKVAELDFKYQNKDKLNQIAIQKKSLMSKNTTIALLISMFIGVLLLFIIFIIKQKQKKLKLEKQITQDYTKQLLDKTEEERKRIASDLHDSVSHELLSLKNSLEAKSDVTNKKIDSILNDIRSISRNLHPVMFDKLGLKSSIEQLVERAQSFNNFMVTSIIDYNSGLSISNELQLYRIIQEALSNIIKYADAVAARISIIENETSLNIEIIDNGKGFNVAETLMKKDTFGLHNIIERSKAIGGNAKITSNKNGTIIKINIKKQL